MLVTCFCVATVLIFHNEYDDGIVGKVALGMIQLAAFGVVWDSIEGVRYEPLPVQMLFTGGATVFFLRFIYRWERWRLSSRRDFNWTAPTNIDARVCFVCLTVQGFFRQMLDRITRAK
jgi:hypothetical protein